MSSTIDLSAPGQPTGAQALAPQGHRVPAVITLRPLASGLPFGFFGLVAAACITGAQAYGFLPPTAGPAIGYLLLPTVLLQLIGGVSCIMGRDVISASLMLTFSGVWLGTAIEYIVQPMHGELVLGVWYLSLVPVIGALISAGVKKLALAMVPMVGMPTFLIAALWLVGGTKSHGLGYATGILSFVLAAFGFYAATALLQEDARRRTVLPTLRSGPMKEAFTGDFESQLTDIEHEAGVRRYV